MRCSFVCVVVVSWLLCVGCLLLLFVLVVDRCLLLVGVVGSMRSLLTLFDGWCWLFVVIVCSRC